MPLPTVYTETALAEYLHVTLGETAEVLGWQPTDARYNELVNDALLRYGVTTIEQATDIQRLRILARVALWYAVASVTVGYYAFSIDQQSTSFQHVHAHAQAMLKAAEAEAASLGGSRMYGMVLPNVLDPSTVESTDLSRLTMMVEV